MKNFCRLFMCCISAFCVSNSAYALSGQSSPKIDECSAEHGKAHALLASIKNFSLSRQIISVDEFLSGEDVRVDCYVAVLLPFEDKDINLVLIDASGIVIKPEYSFQCSSLKIGRRCGFPYYEERPLGEDHIFTPPIPLGIKTLRVISKWDDAKLIGIYDFHGKQIKEINGEFTRPVDGTRIIALYRISAPLKYRKYEWLIHSKEMRPSSVDIRHSTQSLKDMKE